MSFTVFRVVTVLLVLLCQNLRDWCGMVWNVCINIVRKCHMFTTLVACINFEARRFLFHKCGCGVLTLTVLRVVVVVVVGGDVAPKPPWLVSVGGKRTHQCSG
jgi:hypothetical protein